jgi:hypothetical protein
MTSQADTNLSRVCRGKLRRRSILLREASVKYIQMPKKINYPWKRTN